MGATSCNGLTNGRLVFLKQCPSGVVVRRSCCHERFEQPFHLHSMCLQAL